MSQKRIAIGLMVAAAVRLVKLKHHECHTSQGTECVRLVDLRLTAIAYVLATLRAIVEKRVDADRKPGQATREQLAAVIEELRVALKTMNDERMQQDRGDVEHGATQAPGRA